MVHRLGEVEPLLFRVLWQDVALVEWQDTFSTHPIFRSLGLPLCPPRPFSNRLAYGQESQYCKLERRRLKDVASVEKSKAQFNTMFGVPQILYWRISEELVKKLVLYISHFSPPPDILRWGESSPQKEYWEKIFFYMGSKFPEIFHLYMAWETALSFPLQQNKDSK